MDGQIPPVYTEHLALELPFTEHCQPFGPKYDVFKVGGKTFMLVTEPCGRPPINLKSDSQKSLLNQQIHSSVKLGYHMNKKHWISVYPGDGITESLLAELTNGPWHRVVDGLLKQD